MTGSLLNGFCRDCHHVVETKVSRCPACKSPAMVQHEELFDLSIAHIDCDAFFAAVEKRDDPALQDKPVIIGGGKRGVVSTACYVARISGVRSAMPMFKAKKLCPDAVIVRGNMKKYSKVGAEIRQFMRELTPLVEPISIDEAFLDLTGTERLLKNPPALSLAKLAERIHREIGITVSVGLSHNKYLAKVASDFDKPRGFSIIGKAETLDFLADKPVSFIWGVGKAMQNSLARQGITTISQLRKYEKSDLMGKFGVMGSRLYHLSRGEDGRKVTPSSATKSISNETTFFDDVSDYDTLERRLWKLCENVSRRAKAKSLAGSTVTVKLKTADFKSRTRATSLSDATFLVERIFAAARPLLKKQADGTKFRLLGVGISHLEKMSIDQLPPDLDQHVVQQTRAEIAMDTLRDKFGADAVGKGRGFTPSAPKQDK
jgi:DNA polymerase-4